MKDLLLYSTLGCHLCEQALDVIEPLLAEQYRLIEVDISDSDELVSRYGIRIPVVARCDNHREIDWPFDRQQLLDFLR